MALDWIEDGRRRDLDGSPQILVSFILLPIDPFFFLTVFMCSLRQYIGIQAGGNGTTPYHRYPPD